MTRLCQVDGCNSHHHAKGYCRKHYISDHASSDHDSFARSSATRAWQAALDANHRIEELLARLERIENAPPIRRFRRCGWCGDWTLAPVCATCIDLKTPAELLEEALSA